MTKAVVGAPWGLASSFLFWVKKEDIKERRKKSQHGKQNTPPPPSPLAQGCGSSRKKCQQLRRPTLFPGPLVPGWSETDLHMVSPCLKQEVKVLLRLGIEEETSVCTYKLVSKSNRTISTINILITLPIACVW